MRLGGKPDTVQIIVVGLRTPRKPRVAPVEGLSRLASLAVRAVVVSLRSTTRSLRASLALLVAVLASAVFPERLAPFSPARLRPVAQSMRVGLKGAAVSTNPDDASTGGTNAVSDEEHSESRESRRRGLSRWFRFLRRI